jgi:putative tryptophan/tyrosine transport system substrate-binding protein
MISINDPVGTGLVASLARPGGHTTGMATLNDDLTPKMLEFQRTIVPKAKVVATLFNPANPTNAPMLDNLRTQAGAMGMIAKKIAKNKRCYANTLRPRSRMLLKVGI